MTFRLIAAAVIFLAPPAYSQDEIPAGCVRVRERLEYEKKVLEFNSGKMDAMGYFIENGVPSDVGNAFLGAGGPPASREGASKSVLGTFVPYNKELRDLKVGAPPAGRYVSRGSLEQQLTYAEAEIQPLKQTASLRTFSFSNTVTTNHGNGLGWQGLNFRLKPGGETFKIRAHFRLTDATTRAQHEVVKLSGVNLIHGAYAHLGRLAEVGGVEARREVLAQFIQGLSTGIGPARIEIDLIDFEGSIFNEVDPHFVGHHLLKQGLTQHLLFSPEGKMVPVYEALYGKPVIVFNPEQAGIMPAVENAKAAVASEAQVKPSDVLSIEAVDLNTMGNLGSFDPDRFAYHASRPDWVMVTSGADEKKVASFLTPLNTGPTGIVTPAEGASSVEALADPSGKRKTPIRVFRGAAGN